MWSSKRKQLLDMALEYSHNAMYFDGWDGIAYAKYSSLANRTIKAVRRNGGFRYRLRKRTRQRIK